MTNAIIKETNYSIIANLKDTQKLCQTLLETPHYAHVGIDGIFAIVEAARFLHIDPRQALNGGLYYVKGKVEISIRLMNSLIRSRKHSVTRDKRSDDTICILHGKRADNGDTWKESFTLEEARQSGLINNSAGKCFTRSVLFEGALVRLADQLFPDVIGNIPILEEVPFNQSRERENYSESKKIESLYKYSKEKTDLEEFDD
ncbi:MAG: hypothetical protein ACRDAI_05810 [Candidatus Rhabdochlamydia sp.]